MSRRACKAIAAAVSAAALCGAPCGRDGYQRAGRAQQKLDVMANDILRQDQRMGRPARRHGVRGAGGAVPDPGGISARPLPAGVRSAGWLVAISTSTSRWARSFRCCARRRAERADGASDFLQPGTRAGRRRLCDLRTDHDAGAHAGPGRARLHAGPRDRRVHADPSGHAHPGARRSEFAINASQRALLGAAGAALRRRNASAGKTAPRGKDFNMRWIASMVAEVHRILMRGGVFMYPRDTKDPTQAGPAAPAVRGQPDGDAGRAGGRRGHAPGASACSKSRRSALHQRVPVILGSRDEVERIERYHAELRSRRGLPFTSPLFNDALAVPPRERRLRDQEDDRMSAKTSRSSPSPARPAPAPRR